MGSRKSKEYIYNYVDRVRFAEGSFPDYKCPSRGSGWRQNKSVSHLDLATSCHSAASGLNHWSSSHQSRHQLRHSRSLDYNHIDRCKDALDIAEYYWRLDHDPEVYDEEEEVDIEPEHTGSQLKYVSEHHHYRDFKCADENYHHSANNIYQTPQQHQQQQQQQQTSRQSSAASLQHQPPAAAGAVPPQAFEFASDSCSLRRSRSLAVIREETFSDLQISSSNGSRRSQLIPRARLVNRGYFRERDRLIYSNNKHHHHHHASREKLANCSGSGSGSVSGSVSGSIGAGAGSSAPSIDADEQSNESIAETCDSHQQQLQHYKQQQQQQLQKSHSQQQQQQQQPQHLHYHPLYHEAQQTITSTATTAAAVANDYYDHLKRLDKLALGLVAEQLHPWHNDKSDLESLNSDYFKNSLHQSHELKQQHFEIEALEQAVNLLTHEKPRIYQSRRQKHHSGVDNSQKLTNSAGASGGESCPENSQSSVFPETTTSNSDDQSDSGSLSEQEYDITKIEEIYQKTHVEGDEDSYEIISLTTTTRTRFESTGDEGEDDHVYDNRRLDECDYSLHAHEDYTEESNLHTTTDTEVEGTLKRSRAVSENLQKIIAYDSVYLSSEESSDSTLVDTDHCDTSLEVTSLRTCLDEVETVLHISIEDAIYEPKAKHNKLESQSEDRHEPISFVETVNTKIEILEEDSCDDLDTEDSSPIYTQILKVEHTPSCIVTPHSLISAAPVGVTSSAASKPKILSVVEKRKLKRYSDSAYSSNVSDSSDKTHGNYPSNESSAFSHHLKRQVAEPLYIPLKSNLSDNQYHSLPDVNIGQSLKVSESIDAQLRSSYNFDNYRSLDDNSGVECDLDDTADASAAAQTTTHVPENHYNSNSNSNSSSRKKREEVVTSEQIYDSIKRFGRAHQKYRQREIKECQQQQQQQQGNEQPREQTHKCVDQNVDVDEEPRYNFVEPHEHNDITLEDSENYISAEESAWTNAEDLNHVEDRQNHIEATFDNPADDIPSPPGSDQYDSFEKSKEAPAITVENFSQLIERRAKEIRQSGRRNKQQQIEFANRSKFRLENTLASYSETNETKAYAFQSKPISATFRIVVTDAQNNIIEEDSIESQEGGHQLRNDEEDKENHNFANLHERLDQSTNDLLFVKFNKDRFKDRTSPLNSCHRQSSLKRAPSKPKRQQYPANLTHQHLSSAETKKLLLSPKSKERRVLSNQIYRARPVKVITATDSFRRNKVKQANSKMSRPQILQVIDNKRKLITNSSSNTATATNHIEGCQVENEYLKKVDAVRCYWSKLVNDEDVEDRPQQLQLPMDGDEVAQVENSTRPEKPEHGPPQPPQGGKEQTPKQSTDMESTTLAHQSQEQQHHPEKRQFILGAQSVNATTNAKPSVKYPAAGGHGDAKTLPRHNNPDDYCSFMPSIEIVELDGDKTATIVSAMPTNATADDTLDATEPQFDHIRYKVMKSQQLLRSNGLARNTKEAQFDGLIQYLQEYSFQELLSNNNVVIVEPVRTKIERPLSSSYAAQQQHKSTKDKTLSGLSKGPHVTSAGFCAEEGRRKQHNYSSSHGGSGGGIGIGGAVGSGIKRHFFYQPVRVNRELYEEELPNPDTVRNVRKFFEENILPTPGQGLLTTALTTTTTAATTTGTETTATATTTTTTTTATATTTRNNGNMLAKQTSPKSRRTRKYRYLTIDTSYGHAATTTTSKLHHHRQQQQETQNKNAQQSRKWDTASLSSGVSSGDLSSPCECNEAETTTARDVNQSSEPHCGADSTHGPTTGPADEVCEEHATMQGVHVQDIVNQHNNTSVKKSRATGAGIPVRSSSVRPRNAIYGSSTYAATLHKSGKPNIYRNVYEYHAIQGQLHHDSDDEQAADEDDDDLFGDVDDDENELCDTYYVSNDVLRKIRECGSSVTYYGGRVVQTSTTAMSAPKTFESHCHNGNNGLLMANSTGNNNAATTMTLQNPTMLSQTQTRARVREIETCSYAACHPANECLHNNNNKNSTYQNRLLQQKKIHLTKSDNQQNKSLSTAAATKPQQPNNNPKIKPQGPQATANNNTCVEGGITFKLVKSNSCSSRLELAGTDADVVVLEEPEETEVVRKMVHHFETSTSGRAAPHNSGGPEVPLTINNQTPLCLDGQQVTEGNHDDVCVKPVTVNNHINVAEGIGIWTHSTNDAAIRLEGGSKEDYDEQLPSEEPKTFQTEAKDIHLDNSRAAGGGSGNEGTMSAKVCRNKNVDLAFTLVKQQPAKSPGIKDQEIGKNHKLTNIAKPKTPSSNPQNAMAVHDTKCVTYENTLLPTITATSIVNDPHKVTAGSLKVDEETYTMPLPSTLEQIIVPVEIHRAGDNVQPAKQHLSTHKGVEEKCFLPLSTTSSVTSIIDKSVVKHYVANDRSIYEKRKYDDIEFEEFEIYDPTKEFEKLIEEEEAKRAACSDKNHNHPTNDTLHQEGQQSSTSTTSSMRTAKSQHTNISTETETDCYDSLDDKL